MNFVSSMPTSRIGLEQTFYQVFGANLSSEVFVAAAAIVAFTLFFRSSFISTGLR